MLILAGLGNPGPTYSKNRHNLGFMALDAIANRWGVSPWRSKFQGLVCEAGIKTADGVVRAALIKPQTFYNESGRAIGEMMRFFKSTPAEVIVFHDEIDLAPGRFRMKRGGGAAGNNGVRSTTAQIGDDFRRARIGAGHPGDKALVHGYVLSDFHKADKVWLDPLIEALVDALPFAAVGDDERYQAEVLRLAPSAKADPRKAAQQGD
ncbi:MAG: Aminoacyl-tRNA hydrolase [Caulobacter sp.]|nr:Aminoacyl-tRNA hydrolase [Caulobacter sp.]